MDSDIWLPLVALVGGWGLAPGFADVGVSAVTRTLRSFREGQPWAAEPYTDAELRAVAKDPPVGCCRWGIARLDAAVHGMRRPRYANPYVRMLLGRPCVRCRPNLNPPKPKPKPARSGVRSTSTPAAKPPAPTWAGAGRGRRTLRVPLGARQPVVAAVEVELRAAPGVTPAQASYNRQACERLGMDPAKAQHLTRAARP